MKTVKVAPLNVPFDQLPEFAGSGRKVKKKFSDVDFVKPNKINIDSTKLIDAGITHIDRNPGNDGGGLTYNQSAFCVGVDSIAGSFPGGKNLHNLDWDTAEQTAKNLVDNIGVTGAQMLSSQAEEASEQARTAGLCLRNDMASSVTIEYFIGKLQKAKGGRYAGMYDGFGRADILDRASRSDLQNSAAMLAFLRFSPGPGQEGVNTSAGGNKAFLPHTLLNNVSVRGAAEYRDVLFSCYAQGWFEPDREVSTAAFQAVLGKNGLLAMADEVTDNVLKEAILNRRVWNFMWSQSAQIGNNEHVLQRFKPPGLDGVTQAAFFMPNPVGCQRAVTLVSLLEGCALWDWEDSTMYGIDPNVQLGYDNNGWRAGNMGSIAAKVGTLNGQQNGYLGNSNVQLGVNVYKYTANLGDVKVGYPDRCLGNQDISYSALDAYGALRGFTGVKEPDYLAVKDGDTFCATDENTYVYDRFKAKKGWGYVLVNQSAKRAGIAYECFHLEPGQTEQPIVRVAGMDIQLPAVCGGESHEFLIEW